MSDIHWDEFYRSTSVGRYPSEELVRFVARRYYRVADRSAVRFLEVGCGTGPNMWFLAREGFSVTGLDGSAVALEQAAAALAAEGYQARFDLGDCTRLPYADASFDSVIDIECLSAVSLGAARAAVAEMHRVLRPGGTVFSLTLAEGSTVAGTPVEGEPNTYRQAETPGARRSFGVHRFTTEADIVALYRDFETVGWEALSLSQGARTRLDKRWVVAAAKAG